MRAETMKRGEKVSNMQTYIHSEDFDDRTICVGRNRKNNGNCTGNYLRPGQPVVEIVFHLVVFWQTQQVAVLHVHKILRLK